MSNRERLRTVTEIGLSTKFQHVVKPTLALPTGFVYVELISPLSASERGVFLRDYEQLLKQDLDEGLTVWCEPVGDKSALRKLRGIEVKAI